MITANFSGVQIFWSFTVHTFDMYNNFHLVFASGIFYRQCIFGVISFRGFRYRQGGAIIGCINLVMVTKR